MDGLIVHENKAVALDKTDVPVLPTVKPAENGLAIKSESAPTKLRAWRGIIKAKWFSSLLLALASLTIGVLLWNVASINKWQFIINFSNVPTPLQVFHSVVKNGLDQEFYIHILVSMQRVFISFLLAAFLGISIGVMMGRNRFVHAIIAPYIEIMRPIPAVAWIPLAILMWPTEESSIVFITCLGAVFPVILNTIHGVKQTPEVLVRAARSLGASPFSIFRHVVFPAALPSISAGLAIGMGVAWFSLLAGEIISGQYGIGYFTWDAYSMVRTPDIVVGMLAIGFLGSISTIAVRIITQPLLRWQKHTR